jgi:hypothetical protein
MLVELGREAGAVGVVEELPKTVREGPCPEGEEARDRLHDRGAEDAGQEENEREAYGHVENAGPEHLQSPCLATSW